MKRIQIIGMGLIVFSLLVYPVILTLLGRVVPMLQYSIWVGIGQFLFGLMMIGLGGFMVVKPYIPEDKDRL